MISLMTSCSGFKSQSRSKQPSVLGFSKFLERTEPAVPVILLKKIKEPNVFPKEANNVTIGFLEGYFIVF